MQLPRLLCPWLLLLVLCGVALGGTQGVGSIRGLVLDGDFDAPLPAVEVVVVELDRRVVGSDQGNYAVENVPPGRYTLIFRKAGYVQQVREVSVSAGALTDLNVSLAGEFTELEEFVVQDLLAGGAGSEAALLELRFESPALLDSIGAELMSRAGASDAASALRLVSGATIQDGKFAVIRGLPDRYVSSQLNNVRLPSADEDKRAVELDQFPSAVIESLQVSKTFTPDQQGDASGGAVNVRIKGIPEESSLQISGQLGINSQAHGRDDFLSYDGGGVNFWGKDDGGRGIQTENIGGNWDGAVGVSRREAPQDFKWSISGGGKTELSDGVRAGAFGSFFYERDSSFINDGVNNALWVTTPGGGKPTPEQVQVQGIDDFKTALFDITRSSQGVKWGTLAVAGLESDTDALTLSYLYTRAAEDKAILAEDTRGKQFFFPGYDPEDPSSPGWDQPAAAPYLRTETLEYTERTTSTLQLNGVHRLPEESFDWLSLPNPKRPELDWTLSRSTANLYQPDKRQFGSLWEPGFTIPGIITVPNTFTPFKPAANFTLGNLQRIFKEIDERSIQHSLNLKVPFERDGKGEGYLKVGTFGDQVNRSFNQDTFSNFSDPNNTFNGDFDDFWSEAFPNEIHAITASDFDVDYEGNQKIRAWYGMVDVPLAKGLNLIGGARAEHTSIGIVNIPENLATWFPPGSLSLVQLNPGDADVEFQQDDILPSISLKYELTEQVTLRAAYSQTVARQTFKELTPILQQEFLGGPIFVGNPDLQMAALKNYDLRMDYRPTPGGLLSASLFYKDIADAIEYVQVEGAQITYTTPRNYPDGEMFGLELEARQELGEWSRALSGLGVGANATVIESEVTLPADEVALFAQPAILIPITKRDMSNAPEHLFNFYLTYDIEATGTQLGLFYTITGDTLIAGAGIATGEFIPSVYQREYGTLNFSVAQPLGRYLRLQFQAKNLTNPDIKEVYREDAIGADAIRNSFRAGVDYSVSLTARFTF